MDTAAIQVEQQRQGCTIRIDGLVTAALVADLRRLTAAYHSKRCDLRTAWLRTDGVQALRAWQREAGGNLELLLPETIALQAPLADAAPEHTTPVDLPALLAHEVRGPLAVAHLRLQTLAARLERSEQAEEAWTCRSAIAGLDAVSRLFDTYLTASQPWTLRPVEMGAVCAAAAEDARDLVAGGGVTVRPEGGAGGLWVQGERQALQQLVGNLVRNGLEARPGGGRVCVDLRAPPGGGSVEVLVSDDGPGFPAEVLEAPFEPRRSRKAGGMGIGLILCRWIAQRHDGQVQLRNTGAGAEVHLVLPRVPPPDAAAPAAGAPATGSAR